mgnify:CR=1 FL=1
MVILIAWLVMGILGTIAIGFATRRITQVWDAPGMPYLTAWMVGSTLYHTLVVFVAWRAILLYAGAPVGVGSLILTVAQAIVTIPALAFAAFLLGMIGGKDDPSRSDENTE